MENKKNKKKNFILAIALLLFLFALLFSVLGNFTHVDPNYDVYTIGNVEVKITSNSGSSDLGNLLPNASIPYSLAAKNIGINDAYVFMSIIIPCEEVVWTNDDGMVCEKNMTQIFSYHSKLMEKNSEWKLVDVGFIGDENIHDVSYIQNNTEQYGIVSGDKIIYVYGYVGDNTDGSLEALAPDYETSNLMDFLKLANISNPVSLSGEITTKLYAIQVTKLDGGLDEVDAVWDIVNDTVINHKRR
jgi:hypothetical protein